MLVSGKLVALLQSEGSRAQDGHNLETVTVNISFEN